jgi:hypothetical protein
MFVLSSSPAHPKRMAHTVHGRGKKARAPALPPGFFFTDDAVMRHVAGWGQPTFVFGLCRAERLPTASGPVGEDKCTDHYVWRPGPLQDEPRPVMGQREMSTAIRAANAELSDYGLRMRMIDATPSAYVTDFVLRVWREVELRTAASATLAAVFDGRRIVELRFAGPLPLKVREWVKIALEKGLEL